MWGCTDATVEAFGSSVSTQLGITVPYCPDAYQTSDGGLCFESRHPRDTEVLKINSDGSAYEYSCYRGQKDCKWKRVEGSVDPAKLQRAKARISAKAGAARERNVCTPAIPTS